MVMVSSGVVITGCGWFWIMGGGVLFMVVADGDWWW